MSRACFDCGHRHPTMAHAHRGDESRAFCHEPDHSCYVDRHGEFFTDTPDEDYAAALERILQGLLDYMSGGPRGQGTDRT